MRDNSVSNVLASLAPKPDPVVPTVKDDVARLITQHGKDAVIDEVKRATKPRRGRRPAEDLLLLKPYFLRDAFEWLVGHDPTKIWSNHKIARSVAKDHPGQSEVSTYKRLMLKLPKIRRTVTLTNAWQIGYAGHPHAAYLLVMALLAEDDEIFGSLLQFDQSEVERFRQKYGEPPAEMSMADIRTNS